MKTAVCLLIALSVLCLGAAQAEETLVQVTPGEQVQALEEGFSAAAFSGDDHFETFLAEGGASSDAGVIGFLSRYLLSGLTMNTDAFACSALSVPSAQGGRLFGRNFDWYHCDALVVLSRPENAYDSISTVNMGFLGSAAGMLEALPQNVRTLAALYAPLDGMNEKGLCVAVLMISDGNNINQQTEKPDITTTTAIRLLLNKAANVEEAVALLEGCDMHASMGLMVHFAIADAQGKSVVAEYVNNELIVTGTPVVTNFYLSEGERYGIGTAQSHERFETLTQALATTPQMTMADVRDAMESACKRHFQDGETTEWTVVCDQSAGEIRYYHRENYETGYVFTLPPTEVSE